MTTALFDIHQVTNEVAELLGEDPSVLSAEANLLDAGMDSIRLMTLVERWALRGATVEFPELAEQPNVAAWTALLNERTPAGIDDAGEVRA